MRTGEAVPMNSIEVVKRAIEYAAPPYLPFELLDVPEIYSAYFTRDPHDVVFIEGTENFDSLWVGYSWSLQHLGENEQGEPLRRDEWGVLYKVPRDESSAYVILENPLSTPGDVAAYRMPDPKGAQPFFQRTGEVIDRRYRDRFINGYVDPGPFLVAFALMGYENLLMNLIDNTDMVKGLIADIFSYQKQIVRYFRDIGAHMITLIDELAGSSGLMFSPVMFREEFLPLYRDFFTFVKSKNLYSAILLDGNVTAIVDDIIAMDTDCVQFMEPHELGIDEIAYSFSDKRCIKTSVDMKTTLATGTPSQVRSEVHRLVRSFHTERGGFIPIILRWYRPSYPDENVEASVEALRQYWKK